MANVTKIIGGLKSLMTHGGDKALPLALPRANVPSAYINQQAERVARQMLGEHVTSGKAGDTKNLAGRSMKESQRVKGLDYKVTPTGTVAQEVVHTPRIGDVNVGTVGDQTISDSMLESVGDIYGINSQQEGGAKYALGQRHIAQPEYWKSGKEAASRFQNKVNRLGEFYEPDRLIGTHVAMGPTSNNFAMHLADANMKAIDWSKVTPESISSFDDIIRTKHKDPQTGKPIPFPEWPGLADPEGAFKAMQENPLMRKWFNDRMKTPSVTEPRGLPNGLDIQYAITEPSLRDMEINMTGLMTGELQPNALTEVGGAPHNTYSTPILSKEGTPVGGQEVLTPFTLAYPDTAQHIATTKRPSEFTSTIQKVVPHQIVDDQFINQYNQYRERIKELTGKKKGGEVRKHGHSFEEDLATAFAEVIAEHNPKPMHGEITVKTSAPVKMGAGGVITKAMREANLAKFLAPSAEKRRMYHVSKEPNITEFKSRHQMTEDSHDRDAVFLSPKPEFTNSFARGEGTTTYPVYAQIEKPFDFDNPEHLNKVKETYLDMYHNPDSDLYDHYMLPSERSMAVHTFNKRVDGLPSDESNWDSIENQDFQDVLKDLGFDSFYTREQGTKNLGVYDGSRIKSAIGNRGTYDINESDMSKAHGGLVHMGAGGKIVKGLIGAGRRLTSTEKAASDAIGKAAESAGVNPPVMANKMYPPLTNLQDSYTSLGDKIRARVIEAQKQMDTFDYKYDKGQRVFTEDSAKKNRAPYEILQRHRMGNYIVQEDPNNPFSKKVIDPETGKAQRTPYEPAYWVRHQGMENPEDWYEELIPQTAIKGDVEMAKGGGLRMAMGGAVTSDYNTVPDDNDGGAIIQNPSNFAKGGVAQQRNIDELHPIHMGYGGLAKRALRGLKGTNVAEGNKTSIIKDTGGNWLGGNVEKHLSPLRQTVRGATPADRLAQYRPLLEAATDDASRALIQRDIDTAIREDALDKWVGGNLTKYVKNQMGTAEDPVRKLAEQGIVHYKPPYPGSLVDNTALKRAMFGTSQMGVSDEAKAWENLADYSLEPSTVGNQGAIHRLFAKRRAARLSPLAENREQLGDWKAALDPNAFPEPWMAKVDPKTKVYEMGDTTTPHALGYDHILDVLREDLTTGRILPENLNKMNMELAVRRTYQYDQEMAEKMRNTQIKNTEGMPIKKDYADKGYKWQEIALAKDTLPEGFKILPDHTNYKNPGNELFHMVDDKGSSVSFGATEAEAMRLYKRQERLKALQDALNYEGNVMGHCVGSYCDDVVSGRKRIFSLRDAKGEPHVTIETRPSKDILGSRYATENYPELIEKFKAQPEEGKLSWPNFLTKEAPELLEGNPELIYQMKAKQNSTEYGKYLPYVQDFIKGDPWTSVGDFGNTGLTKVGGKYLTEAEHAELLANELKPDGMAKGGLVHMAPGGVVKWASQLAKTINSHKMESMSGEQWMKWLNANAPKSAKKEALASGTLDWLPQQGKVSKGAIIEHMKANAPQIKVKKFSENYTPELQDRYDELHDKAWTSRLTPAEREEMQELEKAPTTKFHDDDYRLPGGSNYREMTLSTSNPTGDNYIVPGAHSYGDNAADINRILHMRMDDRPNKGGKALNIDELQSDWAQQGRSRGFSLSKAEKRRLNDIERTIQQSNNLGSWTPVVPSSGKVFLQKTDPYTLHWGSPVSHVHTTYDNPSLFNNEQDALDFASKLNAAPSLTAEEISALYKERDLLQNSKLMKGLPAGPYVQNTDDWTKLGLRNAIKEAIEQGHNAVTWTGGEAQAKRYDLSKHLDRIDHNLNADGTYNLSAIKNGSEVFSQENIPAEQLAEHVGKDAADKIIKGEGVAPTKVDKWEAIDNEDYPNLKSLTGLDLQVGGEGMKGYYNQIMQYNANDILKKEMGLAERVSDFDVGTGVPHQGFNITPEMIDYVEQNGLQRFQDGGQAHYNKAEQVVESTQDLIDKFVEMYEKASGKEPKPPKEVFRDPWHMKDGGAPPRRDVSELIPFSPHLPSAVSAGLDWVKGKVLDEAKTYSNPRAIPDVAANVAADWAGMPVDIAKILADVADYGGEKVAHAITGRSSKKLSDLVKEDEHEKPTFGSSEYIKDYLKEKGVTTGTERPISEFAAFPVAPALLRGATRTGKKYLNQPPHLTQKEYDDILSGQSPRKLRNVDELIPIHMGVGGAITKIIKPSELSKLKEYMLKKQGTHGAQRVERASDEVPNLEKMYDLRALRSAFGDDKQSAVAVINPADFERYSSPLSSSGASQSEIDEQVKYLRSVGKFPDVPYLNIHKYDIGEPIIPGYEEIIKSRRTPRIVEHNGRHRSRALTANGEESSLVRVSPILDLKKHLKSKTHEEYLDELYKEMAKTDNMVRPETYVLDDGADQHRPAIALPEMFSEGGVASKRNVNELHPLY